MKRKLFSLWLFVLAVVFTSNIRAQVTLGNTNGIPKAAETFSALEVVSNGKGGLRLPQLSKDQKNALAIAALTDPKKALANGLTIYNTTTNCVEYWNSARWISLCEGTSMTTISPQPCTAAADGTGCDQTFTVADPDCPNGPFSIAIMAGSEYATLGDINSAAGTFKVNFKANESITPHTVLVRVTSSCTGQFKDFLFMQNAITCDTTLGTAPAISPSGSALTLCTNGAVYLSVPATTANLDKVIWTRNGIEVARGVNYYVATMPGTYNISLGAAGCNVNSSNERVITNGGPAPSAITTIVASNNGIMCGPTGSITLTAVGASGAVSWFKNGILDSSKTGTTVTLTGTADAGNWFAAAGSGGCYSKPSNTVTTIVQTPSGVPITVNNADVLINNKPINQITSFCSGGSLILKVNNPQPGVSYTWYNDQTIITSPYTIPAGATDLLIRMVATDNSGAACPVEAHTSEVPITGGTAPGTPTITGAGVICDGTADLTVVPKETGTYTYQWYREGVAMSKTTQTISVTEPGVTYSATVTNVTGCISSPASKTISSTVSSLPILTWVTAGTTANNGDKITYQTAIENGPATYAWSVDGGATYVGTGSSITVTYPTSGTTVNLKVKATNACGTSAEIAKVITLSPSCPTPVVTATTATTLSTVAGIGVEAKVTVTGGNQQSYQWYTNTSAATTGGTAISGANSSTVTFTPQTATPSVVYLYCVVTNGCTPTTPVASASFTVNVSVNPMSLNPGSGTFSGKTCFDINKSNDGAGCGTNTSRTASMTNFATQNVQNYVFTASATGTKKNLRFMVIDAQGAVQSTNADAVAVTGNVTNSQVVTLTVTYKPTLSDVGGLIYGLTTANAVNVKIYAVYNDGNQDLSVPLNVKIQDCACCGAYVAAGVWKTFMCHNLGADQSVDYTTVPTTNPNSLIGDWYQYGQTAPVSTIGYANITSNNRWALTAANPLKGLNDPCPTGYRVPTAAEWTGVVANNTVSKVGTWIITPDVLTSIAKIGESLYIPLAGTGSSTGVLYPYVNKNAYYYASDPAAIVTSALNVSSLAIYNASPISIVERISSLGPNNQSMSVRCIQQ